MFANVLRFQRCMVCRYDVNDCHCFLCLFLSRLHCFCFVGDTGSMLLLTTVDASDRSCVCVLIACSSYFDAYPSSSFVHARASRL